VVTTVFNHHLRYFADKHFVLGSDPPKQHENDNDDQDDAEDADATMTEPVAIAAEAAAEATEQKNDK
jgi:hypothetical protein